MTSTKATRSPPAGCTDPSLPPAARKTAAPPRLPLVLASVVGLAASVLGCTVELERPAPAPAPAVEATRARSVSASRRQPLPVEDRAEPLADGSPRKPGSGRPDETNGVCRLFAPELPEPTCCPVDVGFDPSVAQAACGLSHFLGESQHFTCGHYFNHPRGETVWFRSSIVHGSPQAAAEAQAGELAAALGVTARAEPVPGLAGAVWVHHEETSWAFVPGEGGTRRLTWNTSSCSRSNVVALLVDLARRSQTPPRPRTPPGS